MKRIWRRLKVQQAPVSDPTTDGQETPRRGRPKDAGTAKSISTREAVRRFRAHALEDKDHEDVVRVGLKDALWSDLYHHALTANWWVFTFWAVGAYIAINLLFALLYDFVPGQISAPHPVTLADLFFFSVQTLSTVGYGVMAPSGPVANSIVSVEVLVGMMINALAAGAVFARIARPRARIIFSNTAVISNENNVPVLCLRIANMRRSVILSLDVEVALSRLTVTPDGHLVRQFEPLLLVQAHVPVLRFAFVVAHVITEQSPLHIHTLKELDDEEAEIIVTVTGTDEAMGQTVFARTSYAFDRVLHNHRFVDIINSQPGGGIAVDYSRFHETEQHAVAPAP